ncbi:MAG: phage Gp37/Gp68 family protein [Calditrichaeota bacterium]|nr:phage Gp37/Gp68 family protein [Calditrichota bacterium]
MSTLSAIEWTNTTWNPVTGCTKVSPGCKFCYAERFANRLQRIGQAKYASGFQLTLHPGVLNEPLRWRTPHIVFVNSMSDLFHKDIPQDFIQAVFEVMQNTPRHTFQILTKRAEWLVELAEALPWPENVWMGVSVENADYTYRIDLLRQVPAVVRFLSLEPLLGPISDLNLKGIQWVIVGGESGPQARPMKPEWVREIRAQCFAQEASFFFKQWGGFNKKSGGRILDGRTWDEMPDLNRKPAFRLAI